MKKSITIIVVGLILNLVLIDCKKAGTNSLDSTSGSSVSASENMSSDLNQIVAQSATDSKISGKTSALCATVTLAPNDTVTFPKTVTLDFGTGCTGPDGVTRKGSMTCVYTGRFHTSGTSVTVTFQNYSVNGNTLEGTFVITNTSSGNGVSFTTQVTGGKITEANGNSFTWAGTRALTQTAGASTPAVISDDEYTYSGSTTGVNFKGKSFTTTSQNIVMSTNCKYLLSGTTTIYEGVSRIPYVLDYGSGSCDNTYTLTYGSISETLAFLY